MTDVHLTDDDELAIRLTARTRAALSLSDLIGGGTVERIAALLSAAAVLIEREVGVAMAPAALGALLDPTLAAWQAPPAGAGRH